MALEIDTPEILLGTRAHNESQRFFRGAPDPLRKRRRAVCDWYDTSVSAFEGDFCMITADSKFEDLVGELVVVKWHNKKQFLYCVGGFDFDEGVDIALARKPFMYFTYLSSGPIRVTIQALVREDT